MTNPEILEWIKTAPGVAMNLDGAYGYQCVDLANQYACDIFGVPWRTAMTGVTGAKQILDAASDTYFTRTDNNPNRPEQIPAPGDVVVWGGNGSNRWGHVAVVESADQNGMWVVQQDGFAPPLQFVNDSWYSAKPAHRAWLGYDNPGTGMVSGWLTPRPEKIINSKPVIVPSPAPVPTPSEAVASNERIVGAFGVVYRKEPKVAEGNEIDTFNPNVKLTFNGFIRGQNVQGNDIWFRGAFSGGWCWSGAFDDSSTTGLPDLTPAAPVASSLAPNQRKVGDVPMNQRSTPNVDNDSNISAPLDAGFVFTARGYVFGQSFNGINLWYVGNNSGHYVWAGGCTTQTTDGLKNLDPAPAPSVSTPAPAPAPVEAVKPSPAPAAPADPSTPVGANQPVGGYIGDLPCVTEFIPAHPDNYAVGNFALKPAKYACHQFGTLGIDTISSSINWFLMGQDDRNRDKKPGETRRGPSSAHFLVSKKRIVQMVLLKNRAYHAGTNGNDFVGIEIDPAFDAETVASVRLLIKELNEYYGYPVAVLVLHKNIAGNATYCGTDIDLTKLEGVAGFVPGAPKPSSKDEILADLEDIMKKIMML